MYFVFKSNIYNDFKIIYNGFGDIMDIKSLSLKEKVLQKFMFGINSHNIDVIVNLIKKYPVGGVILYKKNYSCYEEMLTVIKKLKNANRGNKIPLLIAVDQEGGRVNRMPAEIKNIRNVYDLSKNGMDLIYESGDIAGEMLSSLGINMNLAPVMDVYENSKSKILYNRCFYGGIDEVSASGRKYIEGISKHEVISVIKHFPGHGASKIDSHFITPYIRDYDSVLNKHIVPFDNVFKSGIDAVMVGHLVIKKLTGGVPASISKEFINKYIRERNRFNGIVITDDISMLSHTLVGRYKLISKAFNSGSDIILMKIKNNNDVKLIDRFINKININDEIEDSVKRILDVKMKYNINDEIDNIGMDIEYINKKIDKLNSKID